MAKALQAVRADCHDDTLLDQPDGPVRARSWQ